MTTASISANKSADGSTVTDGQGNSQASPALAALVDAVNTNFAALLNGQQALAEHIAKPKIRSAKATKNPDGSISMQSIEQ